MVVANETKNTQTGTVVQSVVGCSMRVLVLISIALPGADHGHANVGLCQCSTKWNRRVVSLFGLNSFGRQPHSGGNH